MFAMFPIDQEKIVGASYFIEPSKYLFLFILLVNLNA